MSKLELTLNSIGSLKKVEYDKLFQKTITWKKAKSVIVLSDYKLAGKKTTVAIPYKKPAEMIKAFKELKKDKTHPLKKVAAGLFSLSKAEDGTLEAVIELKKGGMNIEKLEEKAGPAFMGIGIILKASGVSEEEEDSADNAEAETDEPVVVSAAIANLAKKASKGIADFKNDLFLRFKSGELEERDSISLEELKTGFEGFLQGFSIEVDAQKEKYAPLSEAIEKIIPQVDKMLGVLDGSDTNALAEMEMSGLLTTAKNIEKDTQKIKKLVLKNLKKQKVTDRDLELVENALEKISIFENSFNAADVAIQEKVNKHYERINTQIAPQLQQLVEKLEAQAPGKATENADNDDFEKRLLEIEGLIAEEEAMLAKAEKELAAMPPTEIPAGADLLDMLG